MCKAVNMRNEDCDVKVDRSTKFGNPYKTGRDGTRPQVIEKYRLWLWKEIQNGRIDASELAELDGKRIGCWCKPLTCHADILVKAVKWACQQGPLRTNKLSKLQHGIRCPTQSAILRSM